MVRRTRSERVVPMCGNRMRPGGASALLLPLPGGCVASGDSETVATAHDGLDVAASVEAVVDLATQLHDVDAHRVGERVGLAVPHVVEQLLLRHDLLGMSHQVFDDALLL